LLGKYLGSFKNTKIDKDDIYAVWDNDFYELFILLLRLNSWSVQIINVNLIFLEAAGLGLIDVVRALLGHDRLDIGYFNEFLQEAIENNHHEIISLLREEYSYLEEQRGEHRAI
jgi:hypothetical protein